MFLARSVRRSKWPSQPNVRVEDFPADTITGDLRSKNNSLSFWHCNSSNKDEIDESVLAIAAGRERVEKLELVWINRADLESFGQAVIRSEGLAPVADLVDQHFDLCRLDYRRLGELASQMHSAMKSGQYQLLSRSEVREILADAVLQNRLRLSDLNPKIQNEIRGLIDNV